MNYYLCLLIVILLINFLCKWKKIDIKKSKRYLFYMCLLLTLFLGLRANNVGADMHGYNVFFHNASTSSFSILFKYYGFEIGFKLYTKIITLIFNNYSFFIFITSILSMLGVYDFIKENSKNYCASIFIFLTFNYYSYLFCALRQVLAISILLFAIRFVKKRNFVNFFLSVLLAATFHKTALLFSIVYFIPNIQLNRKKIIYFNLCALLLFLFRVPVMNFFTKIFYKQYETYRDTSGNGYVMLFFLLSALLGIIYLFKNFDINKKDNKIFVGMLTFCIPLQILATTQGLVARLTLYFSLSLIVLIPNVLETIKDQKWKNILYFFYYVSLICFFCYKLFASDVYFPYQFLKLF